jgi:hypothetical protein
MRKSILTTVAILLIVAFMSGNVLAQVTGLTGYGSQVGLNLANVSGSDSEMPGYDKKFRIGIGAGFFMTYALNEMLSIQPEILYSMKGAKYEATVGDATSAFNLDYLEIPVFLKMNFQTEGSVKPAIMAGPYLGVLLSAKDKTEIDGHSTTTDIKDDFKSTDFGIAFGASLGMQMTKGMPFIGVRYSLGLSTIAKEDSGYKPKVKNNTISILLGYNFI